MGSGAIMKKFFLTSVAALFLVTEPALAKTPKLPTVTITRAMTTFPPPEFDKPFAGEVTIVRLATEKEIHTICPKYGPTRVQTH
jgi:hypothetical protein